MTLNNYAFKKKILRRAASVADRVGYFFRQPPSALKLNPRRILIVRLDQLGDIVQTLPVFDALRTSFPSTEIEFLTTPIGADLFGVARPDVNCIVWNCAWFDASRRENISRGALAQLLQRRDYDCVLEPRGDVRLIWLFKNAGIGPLIGYGATGGGFLLDAEVQWTSAMPAVDKNLELVKAIGGRGAIDVPTILLGSSSSKGGAPRIAIHPDAGTRAKRWSLERVKVVIDALLAKGFRVTLVGLNAAIGQALASSASSPIENFMGKTNLRQLLNVLNECDGLLSNDSGPAHLMAALGKPVWVLWSGTAEASVWAPRGARIKLFERRVDCAPCSLSECPVPGHPCLERIEADEIVSTIVGAFVR